MSAFPPVYSEEDLLERCKRIQGWSLCQLAHALGLVLPTDALSRKGWIGQAIECILGATAGNKAVPDFEYLGIELKTLPMNHLGKPAESTFITSIPLLTIHEQTWKNSQCFRKLGRVLWLPVEGDPKIPFAERRIGPAILWSPTREEEAILEQDWTEFAFLIGSGRLSEIDARMGTYLQIRPKAAHGLSLCDAYDETGNKIQTLPRGFYLRAAFTAGVVAIIDS